MTAERPDRILVIIPTYNEAASIHDVLLGLRKLDLPLFPLVINDCSTDRTSEIVRGFPGVALLDLSSNLGIGGAVQAGLKYARGHGYRFAVQFDGDGQHLPGEIEKILEPVIRAEADMVIGSRFISTDGTAYRSTWLRRAGIRQLAFLIRIFTGIRVVDVTSGFRAYGPAAIAFLARHYPTDFPEPESIVALAIQGLRVREVPAQMQERTAGMSSIYGIKTIYYMIKVAFSLGIVFLRGRGAVEHRES